MHRIELSSPRRVFCISEVGYLSPQRAVVMAIENEPDANEVQEDDLEDDYEEVEEVRRASEHQISEKDDVTG